MTWWPYEFVTLDEHQKALRRHALDHYASLAHWSALSPIAAYLAFKLLQRILSKRIRPSSRGNGAYQRVPGSPLAKAKQMTASGELASTWAKWKWWMADELLVLGEYRGKRDEWLLGAAWFLWLIGLCVVGTGNDYLHLTKRFGLVAVSQMPVQYLLSLKAMNPFAYVFRSSHEEVNRFHRVLSRLIYGLLTLHFVFYNIFFVAKGIWLQKYFEPIVFAGVLGALALNLLFSTALPIVRVWSYRVFFCVHLTVGIAMPLLIFLHAESARVYLVEALCVVFLDIAVRKVTTVNTVSKLESVSGTNLFKITAPISAAKMEKFKTRPASHIYLTVPPESRPTPKTAANALFDAIFNPFTVADVDTETNEITMVIREQQGPLTTHLANLAAKQPSASGPNKTLLGIEAPRGVASKYYEDLVDGSVQRILLITGGVGATFAYPMYRAITQDNPDANIEWIWAIRAAGDATWATSTGGPGAKSVLDDERVQLYLTSDLSASADPEGDGENVEMENLPSNACARQQGYVHRRPDLKKIIDETFRKGQHEHVAVLVCGPSGMARNVRQHLRPWVMEQGRKVWYHEEHFGS